MTDIEQQLAAIEAYCEKATEGPWEVRPCEFDDWGLVRGGPNKAIEHVRVPTPPETGE